MNSFEETDAANLTPELLRSQIGSKGYALIRGLLPRPDLELVLNDVTRVLSAHGWLSPDSPAVDRIPAEGADYGDPDAEFKRVYREVFGLESFHALPHHVALRNLMKMLVGEHPLIHPKPIGRLIFPNCDRLFVRAHQDYEFMGGDPQFFTVWIPLHDCPVEQGPLQILEGSHRFGVQEHQREHLHVPQIPLEAAAGDEWVGGGFYAGDVLIFPSLTVHAASPNVSNRMRISIDCRFQDARRVLNPSNLVFAGESGKSWDEIYSTWRSDTLKFYWRSLPLKLSPSKDELRELASTAASASTRARYARMISQLP
ncbi:MAG TPA: phytanoyl-CoA dioxygenase family protein [Acidobacteriaceae bacterium]